MVALFITKTSVPSSYEYPIKERKKKKNNPVSSFKISAKHDFKEVMHQLDILGNVLLCVLAGS